MCYTTPSSFERSLDYLGFLIEMNIKFTSSSKIHAEPFDKWVTSSDKPTAAAS